jgi:hypothetical protein
MASVTNAAISPSGEQFANTISVCKDRRVVNAQYAESMSVPPLNCGFAGCAVACYVIYSL